MPWHDVRGHCRMLRVAFRGVARSQSDWMARFHASLLVSLSGIPDLLLRLSVVDRSNLPLGTAIWVPFDVLAAGCSIRVALPALRATTRH